MTRTTRSTSSLAAEPPGRIDPFAEDRLAEVRVARDQGDHAAVVRVARACIARCPRHPEAYLLMGEAMMRLGRLDEAERALIIASEQRSGFAAAHAALARFYRNRRVDLFMHGHHCMLALRAGMTVAELDPVATG